MASCGKFRIVKKEGSSQYEIARDFISNRGVQLAFGSAIRFTQDYEILPYFFDTPEEAYQALITLQQQKGEMEREVENGG